MSYELTRSVPMMDEAPEFYTFSGQLEDSFSPVYTSTCFSLYKCVDKVLITGIPEGAGAGCTMINDVHEDLFVCTHKETLADILTRLSKAVVTHSPGNTVHISAKSIGNISLIHFKGKHAALSGELKHCLQQTEMLVEKLGGCITISNNRKYGVDLAFTFVNH